MNALHAIRDEDSSLNYLLVLLLFSKACQPVLSLLVFCEA